MNKQLDGKKKKKKISFVWKPELKIETNYCGFQFDNSIVVKRIHPSEKLFF